MVVVRALSSHFKPEEEVEKEEEKEDEEEGEANRRHSGHVVTSTWFHTYNQKSYQLKTLSWFQDIRIGKHSIFCFYLHPHQASLRNSSSSFPLSSAALGPLHRSVVSPCLSRTTNRGHCTHLHIGSCLQERLLSE